MNLIDEIEKRIDKRLEQCKEILEDKNTSRLIFNTTLGREAAYKEIREMLK